MRRRRLHTLHRAPSVFSEKPPLLFVHGGYVDARCWDAYFLPYFTDHGYDCYALNLSGHGASEGREHLDALGIDDYLADVVQVIAGLAHKPVIIGHSMGALLAERILERSLAVAGVLLSPVPPTGTWESTLRLLPRYPQFLPAVGKMLQGNLDADSLQVLKEVYFTPDTAPETLLRLAHLVQPESLRAICDMALLFWRWPAGRPRLPVLVVGGEKDALFPPYMVKPVARNWRTELTVVAGAGHAMILDRHWQSCAASVLTWLKRLQPASAPPAALCIA